MAALGDAELGCLFQCVGKIHSATDHNDGFSAARLCLQHVGGIVGSAEWVLDGTHDLAACGLDESRGLGLHRRTESIVHRDEVEVFDALVDQQLYPCFGQRVSVNEKLDAHRRTRLAGKVSRQRTCEEIGFLLFLCQPLHAESDGRRRSTHYRVDLVGVQPFARSIQAHVRFVLVIEGQEFNLLASHRSTEIFNGHSRCQQ